MEFPFNLKAGTLAKASEVMANFNAIRTLLEAGLTLDNMAEGTLPIAGESVNATQVNVNTAEGIGPKELLTGGPVELSVPVKCKALFILTIYGRIVHFNTQSFSDLIEAGLSVDGADTGLRCNLGMSTLTGGAELTSVEADVCEAKWVSLAAGTHAVRVTGQLGNFPSNAEGIFFKTRLHWLLVPVA